MQGGKAKVTQDGIIDAVYIRYTVYCYLWMFEQFSILKYRVVNQRLHKVALSMLCLKDIYYK